MRMETDDLTRTEYGVARFVAPDRQTWAFWTQSDSGQPNVEFVVSRLGVVPPAAASTRVRVKSATYGLRFLDPRRVSEDGLHAATQAGQHPAGIEVLEGTTEDDERIAYVVEVESGRLQALDLPGGGTLSWRHSASAEESLRY